MGKSKLWKPEGKTQIREDKKQKDVRVRYKMNIKERERQDVDWFQLAQDRYNWQAFVNTVLKLYSP